MATKKKTKKATKKPAKKKVAKSKPKTKGKSKAKAKSKAIAKAKAKPKKKIKGQPKPLPPPAVEGTLLGRVDDFFAQVGVIALKLKSSLRVGNSIHIKGHTTDLIEPVTSMQIEHQAVESAQKGDSVGIRISGPARKRDWVFRVD